MQSEARVEDHVTSIACPALGFEGETEIVAVGGDCRLLLGDTVSVVALVTGEPPVPVQVSV